MTFEETRRRVLRRVRYAANVHALRSDAVPPEGLYDTALTNGLLCIVAAEWPGSEYEAKKPGRAKSARFLLKEIANRGGLSEVNDACLIEALDLTQPFRHGSADDEWATITHHHVDALAALDVHDSLRVLDRTADLSLDDCIVRLYRDLAENELPFDPKDRSIVPDAEECDECWRETFLPSGWDMYGVSTLTAGRCVACGYERSDRDADRMADDAAFERAMSRPD